MAYTYRGVVTKQVPEGPEVVLFSAPAVDIERWAGIPQRRRIEVKDDAVETAGFQRESKASRIQEIAKFMQNAENVIQNPLLAATQEVELIHISSDADGICTIRIEDPALNDKSLLELFDSARKQLHRRLPELQSRAVPADLVAELRQGLSEHYDELSDDAGDESLEEGADGDQATGNGNGDSDIASGLFQEETQVVDFYDELNARYTVLAELGAVAAHLDSVGGFSRAYLESLLRPVVLVDGQHRLLGALEAIELARESENGRDRQAQLISDGCAPEEAADQFSREVSRSLPISLLATESPAEHVFQFVVVNQKATPMSNALLGTIVSTSLTNDELDKIAIRLSEAGIRLEASRAVAYLTRSPQSPFCGLVSTGVSGDRPNALPWSVLLRLANMIRELEGGKAFHPPSIDFVKNWARNYLDSTGLIPEDVEDRREYWRRNDGPWRELFIRLHTKIRDFFGDTHDLKAANAWGSTQSNLFNMVSLTILTQDFFAFLREGGRALADWEDVDVALGDWLEGLNQSYFNRDWRMEGTKKDQPAIKQAWSSAWFGYRLERDRMPRVEVYNPGGRRS